MMRKLELAQVSTSGSRLLPISMHLLPKWMANNPNATGGYYWPEDPKQNPLTPYLNDEVKRDQVASKLALEFIRQNPGKFIQLLGVKFRKFYQSDTNAYLFSLTPTHPPLPEALKDRITSIANYYYRTLMVLALAGTGICLFWWRRVRDWPTLVALGGAILYFTTVHSIMPAWDRYRFPIMPLFAVLAGCTPAAIVALGQQLIRGR